MNGNIVPVFRILRVLIVIVRFVTRITEYQDRKVFNLSYLCSVGEMNSASGEVLVWSQLVLLGQRSSQSLSTFSWRRAQDLVNLEPSFLLRFFPHSGIRAVNNLPKAYWYR